MLPVVTSCDQLLLFQLFCLAVCAFSETDALLLDAEERLCSEDARERLRLLPLSVARLLTSAGDTWRPLGVQVRFLDCSRVLEGECRTRLYFSDVVNNGCFK